MTVISRFDEHFSFLFPMFFLRFICCLIVGPMLHKFWLIGGPDNLLDVSFYGCGYSQENFQICSDELVKKINIKFLYSNESVSVAMTNATEYSRLQNHSNFQKNFFFSIKTWELCIVLLHLFDLNFKFTDAK